ncbi:MAG: TIGR03905 family TSCPD domain-containing protein [Ruminococcaceae bacterium]|nr:TIGR03905 family TSCPD domain-containing protein [Oscillospiraceae bacterium]
MFKYKTKGTCSREIQFDVVDGKLTGVKFIGGCAGNTQGVARLVEGMTPDEAVKRLSGIKCGFKPTSCPDQLARAISENVK